MSAADTDQLDRAARRLIELLSAHDCKIVFAESCTAGLVAATLGRMPGISDYLCGSAVVYRNATKSAWLDVSAADLDDPAITAVSSTVAEAMAIGVLKRTPEANLSVSVTGYLGPDAAVEMDGIVFLTVAIREPSGELRHGPTRRVRLAQDATRTSRQAEAAVWVLQTAALTLEEWGVG